MTTTVTVKTHAWPVAVYTRPLKEDRRPSRLNFGYGEKVAPHSERVFYVHSAQDLMIHELEKE